MRRKSALSRMALVAGLVLSGCSWSTTTEGRPGTESPAKTPFTPLTTPSTTPVAVSKSDFSVTFDGNVGLDHFDTGVYHRDETLMASTTWTGDHDLSCGSPDTQRMIDRDLESSSFYLCRDHLMTSIGDTAGYSTGWFSPSQIFTTETSVSWDVNVTDLGARQWWEVALMPAWFDSGVPDCPQCTAVDWLPSGLPAYQTGSIVVGNGPFGRGLHVFADRGSFNPSDWQGTCGDWALDPEGCDSKAIRRPFTLVDNGNNTVTLKTYWDSYTFTGSFPDGGWTVVFKDHNYTPDKDGRPVGHTWHWDNIVVE